MLKFKVSLISLSFVYLFAFFPNNLNYCCEQMRGEYKCVQLLKTSCNQFYICRVLLELMIRVRASAL